MSAAKRTFYERANRLGLTTVFTLSFASYLGSDLTLTWQLVPLILFAFIVTLRVFLSKDLLPAIESLFATDSLLFILFLSVLVIAPSMQSDYDKSFASSLVLSCCLVLGRLYMALVPLSEVLEAFFWSGVISITIFLPLAFASLADSVRTLSRFSVFSFHPNLLAFVLAGYFCAMVWKLMTGGWAIKLIAAPVSVLCLIVVFFASSRGSIVAIIGGCALVFTMWILRKPKQQRSRAVAFVVLSVASLSMAFILVQRMEWIDDTYNLVDKVLRITDSDRGIDSGLTGRVDKWQATVNSLKDGTWLLGHGLRASDSMAQLIDNSYIVSLYEVGIFALALIFFRFFGALCRLIRGYFTADQPGESQMFLGCSLLIAVFLLNNFVARYIFAVGNPYSLLAMLVFVSPSFGEYRAAGHARTLGDFDRKQIPMRLQGQLPT